MAITLGTVIVAARDRHPAFHRTRVSDATLARQLGEYQRQLLTKALLRDRSYLAQQASIIFSNQANSGAAIGGFPVDVSNSGVVSRSTQPTGYGQELRPDLGATLVPEFVPASATASSVTKTAAGWTVNAFVGAVLEVTAGTGYGERRTITANTATVASWSTALPILLDTTSLVRIVSIATSVSGEIGVITSLPSQAIRQAYLTKLDASGVAYIDLTDPLYATFDRGIPLPPFKNVLGGSVRFLTQARPVELILITWDARDDWYGWYAAYVMNRQLFLLGGQQDWSTVESIDLRYTPITPALTALTDYFLLPDPAEPVLVAQAAYVAGARVQGLEGISGVDMGLLGMERDEAEKNFLREITAQKQNTTQRIQSVW